MKAALMGLMTAGFGLALALTHVGMSLEERLGLNWLFWARGPVTPPAEAMVISLDRRSAEKLGFPEKIRDWPRLAYATLIEHLAEAGVSTIIFDLILERKREPAQDKALAEAIADAGRVVLFEALDLQRQPILDADGIARGLIQTQRLRPPLPELVEAAAGLAPFPLPIVPDRVSQFWAFKPGAGGRPTLPATALQRHALTAHPEWISLLWQVGFEGVADLPIASSELERAVDLRRMMIETRDAFRADASLGQRLRRALAKADLDSAKKRLLAALITLYDGPDSRYINFYGPAAQIRSQSLHEFIGAAAPSKSSGRNDLADLVVFVGQAELYEPHNDAFITVYSRPDGVQISGVEIAATAFLNLLDGSLIRYADNGFLMIAGFGLLIGVIAGLLPALWAVPVALGIAVLYLTVAVLAFDQTALWLPTTVPVLAELPFGLFAGLFIQYHELRRARENLNKAIRYYLPHKLAAGLAKTPVATLKENEEAYAYCLITDASGFTRLAETMTSKQLKTFLEGYMTILFEAVETQGGWVTDTAGDGITAAFTAPSPDPAIAAKACQAALAIDSEIQRFNKSQGPRRLPTRIGLHAGWVTLGHVGGSGRFTYTVIGDAVNTASRIEQLNKHLGTRILATSTVTEGVAAVALRSLGRFQLYGKEEILSIAELMSWEEATQHKTLFGKFESALSKLKKQQDWRLAAELFSSLFDDYHDPVALFYARMFSSKTEKQLALTSEEADIIRLDIK